MTTLHQLAHEYTERVNRETERKKNTVRKIVRFAWGIFSYYKGPPVVEGDLASATSQIAIQALSKQMLSGFQDVKLDAVALEGIDLVTGWIMDLIRPSEMQLESQLGMLAMARGWRRSRRRGRNQRDGTQCCMDRIHVHDRSPSMLKANSGGRTA